MVFIYVGYKYIKLGNIYIKKVCLNDVNKLVFMFWLFWL